MKKIIYIFILILCHISYISPMHEVSESENTTTYISLDQFDNEAINLFLYSLATEGTFPSNKDISELIVKRNQYLEQKNKDGFGADLFNFVKALYKRQLKEYIHSLDIDKRNRFKSAIKANGYVLILWIIGVTYFPDFMLKLQPSSKLYGIASCAVTSLLSYKIYNYFKNLQEQSNTFKSGIFKTVKNYLKQIRLT